MACINKRNRTLNKKYRFRHLWFNSNSGSTTIELSLVFIPFIMAMLFLAELCRVVYISSALDLILAESGYRTSLRSSESDYKAFFAKELNNRLNTWTLFSKKIKLNFSVLYCDSVGMLADHKSHCSSTNSVNKPLALYSVSVDYQPLFFIPPHSIINSQLNKKTVFVQEYQREGL